MAPVASFHLVRLPGRRRPEAIGRLATDRRRLAASPGLILGRHMGTARGDSTRLAMDLSRWAVFTVWEDEAALDEWEWTSPLLAKWRRSAAELWTVRLACLTAHGRWGGVEPFPGMAGAIHDDRGGPVVVVTRARVRTSRLTRFYRSTSEVDAAVAEADGRVRSVAFWELPFGWQGTFSLWQSTADLTAFAYGHSHHREVVRRTRAERWYGEELFARFRPYRSTGTWGGSEPLAELHR
jgi:heme-degrading monooxygenase HmoA